MPRGGKRTGSGRRKGEPNKKTKAMIEKAEAEGIMPKDVLLSVMRMCYAAGDYVKAAEIAKDAAPYFSSRLAAVAPAGSVQKTIEIKVVRDDNFYRNADRLSASAALASEAGDP